MTFRQLIASHGRLIGIGLSLTFLSAFGQTFFISLSAPDIREAFGLTHGGFGLIYSFATLSSGLLMIWIGSLIDQVSIRLYGSIALLGLSLAAFSLSVAPNIVALGLSLFALRLFGQGMSSHAGITSTARLPAGIRGRAVGIAALGFPAGEAVLPITALTLVGALGWTGAWRAFASVILVALAVGWLASALLGPSSEEVPISQSPHPSTPGPRWYETLTDRRFVALIPTFIGYPAIVTAFFFHQRLIADYEGWPPELLASGITIFAFTSVCVVMTSGTLVDRIGAVRLSHFYLAGLFGACLVLATISGPVAAPIFFALMGLSAGATNVIVAAVLAELFGTEHLGKIRALAGGLMVVASATTPGLVGVLIDMNITFETISLWFALYIAAAAAATFTLPKPGTIEAPGIA